MPLDAGMGEVDSRKLFIDNDTATTGFQGFQYIIDQLAIVPRSISRRDTNRFSKFIKSQWPFCSRYYLEDLLAKTWVGKIGVLQPIAVSIA